MIAHHFLYISLPLQLRVSCFLPNAMMLYFYTRKMC